MHEQMARLYQAAAKIRDVSGQSAVARLLNLSPQRIKNWEDRGISFEGMIDAEQYIGCCALWLRSGLGPMIIGESYVPDDPGASGGLSDALKLTCETAAELQLLSVFRLANKDERDSIGVAVENIRVRLRRDVFWNNSK